MRNGFHFHMAGCVSTNEMEVAPNVVMAGSVATKKRPPEERPLNNGSRSGDRDCRSGPALAKPGVAKPAKPSSIIAHVEGSGTVALKSPLTSDGTSQAVKTRLLFFADLTAKSRDCIIEQ
jgi:hypothetical protein